LPSAFAAARRTSATSSRSLPISACTTTLSGEVRVWVDGAAGEGPSELATFATSDTSCAFESGIRSACF